MLYYRNPSCISPCDRSLSAQSLPSFFRVSETGNSNDQQMILPQSHVRPPRCNIEVELEIIHPTPLVFVLEGVAGGLLESDVSKAIDRFSKLLQFPSVSRMSAKHHVIDEAVFLGMIAFLKSSYPSAHVQDDMAHGGRNGECRENIPREAPTGVQEGLSYWYCIPYWHDCGSRPCTV